eukprot:scaffold1192_cov169-Amphora_coffeaeformis.AAC.6
MVSARTYFLIVNVSTFALFGFDKSQARVGASRVPEWRLLALSFAGGWLGAKAGQWCFQHKTRKQPFGRLLNLMPVIWCILLESIRPGLCYGLVTQRVSLEEVSDEMQRLCSKTLRTAAHSSLSEAVQQKLQQMRDRVSDVIHTGTSAVRGTFSKAKQTWKTTSDDALQSIRRAANSVKDRIPQETGDMRDAAVEKWRSVFRKSSS